MCVIHRDIIVPHMLALTTSGSRSLIAWSVAQSHEIRVESRNSQSLMEDKMLQTVCKLFASVIVETSMSSAFDTIPPCTVRPPSWLARGG
jgi:hypothetical protein